MGVVWPNLEDLLVVHSLWPNVLPRSADMLEALAYRDIYDAVKTSRSNADHSHSPPSRSSVLTACARSQVAFGSAILCSCSCGAANHCPALIIVIVFVAKYI